MTKDKIIKEIENPQDVMLNFLASSIGLDKYKIIMDTYKNIDITNDKEFQKTFNYFYKIRRNDSWRNDFYIMFERMKSETPSFEIILNEIYDLTGRVEASFASKVLATLYPDKPILDKFVLNFLELKIPEGNLLKRMNGAVSAYQEIEEWYLGFLPTECAKKCLDLFDKTFPDYTDMSDVKKIDFYLWGIRE